MILSQKDDILELIVWLKFIKIKPEHLVSMAGEIT